MDLKIRAFIAMRVSDEVEAALAFFIEKIRSADDGVAWVGRDRLHITLKFLGSAIDSAKLPGLEEALRRTTCDTSALQVRTRGIGGFPNLRRPRVLWTGLECDALIELAARIESAAAEAGFDRAERPWAPHLTIGRVRDPHGGRQLRPRLEAAANHQFGESRIREISLYRSHLSPQGSSYERLAIFPLGAR